MKLLSTIAAAASALLFSVSAQAAVTTIEFTEPEAGGNLSSATTEYSAFGITFANALYYSGGTFDMIDGAGILNGSLDQAGNLIPGPGGFTFDEVVSFVTFDWVALDANQEIAVQALDENGNEVDLFLANTLSEAFGTGTVSGFGIKTILFAGNIPPAFGISTITFGTVTNPVPVPGAAALFVMALGLGSAARRRKKAA